MVDQTNTSPAEKPFRIKYNIELKDIKKILEEQINNDLQGRLFDTDVFSSPLGWLGELKPKQEKREFGHPFEDNQIYLSDFAKFLGSIYLDLKTNPQYIQFNKSLETASNQDEAKRNKYFVDQIIEIDSEFEKEDGEKIFSSDETIIKNIRFILIELLEALISAQIKPTEKSTEIEKDFQTQTSNVITNQTSNSTINSSTPRNQDVVWKEQEGGVFKRLVVENISQLDKIKDQHKAIQLHAGFIYNHIVYDLATIYGLKPEEFPQLTEEVEEAIRSQIVANLYAMDVEQIKANRAQLEKQILQQIFVLNPGLSFQIQEHLIVELEKKGVAKEKLEEIAQTTNIYDVEDGQNRDRLFEKIENIFKDASQTSESDEELKSLDNLADKHETQTIIQVDHELQQLINESAIELPTFAITENIIRVVESKIATRQDPRQITITGVSKSQEEALRQIIEIYWYKKLAASSQIVSSVDQNLSTSALALAHDATEEEKVERNKVAKKLQNQKGRDLTAVYVAHHASRERIVQNKEVLRRELIRQQLRQEFYHQVEREYLLQKEQLDFVNKQQTLLIIQTSAVIQHQMMGYPTGEIAYNGREIPQSLSPAMVGTMDNGRRYSQALATGKPKEALKKLASKKALMKLAELIPQTRALAMLYKHRKLIMAAAAMAALAFALLIAYLLQFILLIVGLMVLAATGIMAPTLYLLLGRENVEKLGNFTIRAVPNLFNLSWWGAQLNALQTATYTGLNTASSGMYSWLNNTAASITGSMPEITLSSTITTSQVAVGGTVGAIGVGAVSYVVLVSPFMQPLPDQVSPDNQEFSKYVAVSKTADIRQMENGETKDITYSFRISPKSGYTITPALINPVDKLSFLGGDGISGLEDPQDCVISGIGDQPFSTTKMFECTIHGVSGEDVMLVNSFHFNFTVVEETEVQKVTATASTVIGDPELGCFVFAEAGSSIRDRTSIAWTPEEQNRISIAIQELSKSPQFMSLICSDGPVTLYRLEQYLSYGGWAFKNEGGIGFYRIGVSGQNTATYTFSHELGHILATRSPSLFSNFFTINQNLSLTYGYCLDAQGNQGSCGAGNEENFAEAIGLYVVHNFYNFPHDWQTSIQNNYPNTPEYQWVKENVFGGVEY